LRDAGLLSFPIFFFGAKTLPYHFGCASLREPPKNPLMRTISCVNNVEGSCVLSSAGGFANFTIGPTTELQ
jgi:hypothetical protein